MRARVTRSKTDRIAVFPEASKPQVKLPVEAFEHDLTLLEKMLEVTGLRAFPEDFLALNGEISEYGWQRAIQLAVYEKYNFLLPYLKQGLPKKAFKELLKEGLLDDFVYVYCCMLTLLLKEGTVETQAEEAAPDELLKAVEKDMDQIDEILKKDIDEGTLRTAFSFAYRRWKTVKDASKPKFEQAMGKLEEVLVDKKKVKAADIEKIKGVIDDLLQREKEREKEQKELVSRFDGFKNDTMNNNLITNASYIEGNDDVLQDAQKAELYGFINSNNIAKAKEILRKYTIPKEILKEAFVLAYEKEQIKEIIRAELKVIGVSDLEIRNLEQKIIKNSQKREYIIKEVGKDLRGTVVQYLASNFSNKSEEDWEEGIQDLLDTLKDIFSNDDNEIVFYFLENFVNLFPTYNTKINTNVWTESETDIEKSVPYYESEEPETDRDTDRDTIELNLLRRRMGDRTVYDIVEFIRGEADSYGEED
tara:strand:- start:1006 stop:2433 length:1428 start_codon:yes stop_codon:yes gene_type:complete